MTVDQRAAKRLRELELRPGPVTFCDVDEVVLDFIDPFRTFLRGHGLTLTARSFRLNGNIVDDGGKPCDPDRVARLLDRFFATQDQFQTLAPGAIEGLSAIAERSQVVLLTAMRHGHFDTRERHLRDLGIDYPLVTTEGSKGLAIAGLELDGTVTFIDDLPGNHADVLTAAPHATAIHYMSNAEFSALLPPLPDGVLRAADWEEVVAHFESEVNNKGTSIVDAVAGG